MRTETRHYSHWYLFSLRGVILILLGVYAVTLPNNPVINFLKIFELFTVLSGMLLIQNALLNRKYANWQFVLFNGLLDLSFGIILWLIPSLDITDLKIVLAIWFLYSGLIQMVDSLILIHDNIKNWWFGLISGMLSFILAFVIIAKVLRVEMEAKNFWFIGIFALILGIFLTITPFFLREPKKEY